MKDKVGVNDHVVAGLSTKVVPAKHPCPSCGKPMKDASTKKHKKAGLDVRICSNTACREIADWSTGKAMHGDFTFEEDPPPPVVTIEAQGTGPEYPCPECGKAMKDANTHETKAAGLDVRICSSKACRAKADWSTGTAVRSEA